MEISNKGKSNIENVWALLCSTSSIDQTKNNISLFNVIEKYSFELSIEENKKKLGVDIREKLKQGINVPTSYQLVSLWSRRKAKTYPEFQTKVLIEILDPQKKILFKNEVGVKFEKNKQRMRFIMEFKHMAITGSGDYLFRIRLKDQTPQDWKKIPLEVNVNLK